MKQIFNNYISRHCTSLPLFPKLEYAPISIVIPCYDELEYIEKTLQSLWNNTNYNNRVNIFIIINQNISTISEIVEINKKTEKKIQDFKAKNSCKNFSISVLNTTFPKASMGVGSARKTGMDEAIKQYNYHNKDGIIVSLDADTICEKNYLSEILSHYKRFPKTNATVINYQHPLEAYPTEQANAIAQYELYLRYMSLCYRYIGHPNWYHTIGSAFSVKASCYCRQGGMNQREAGEDFYFLQKIFDLGNCYELNSTCVYPSGRFSNRVPFGTGKAVEQILSKTTPHYPTYNFSAFEKLKILIDLHACFFKKSEKDCILLAQKKLDKRLFEWFLDNNFFENISEINKNSASISAFSKKFFKRLSILQIIRYLNFSHNENHFKKVDITNAIAQTPYHNDIDFSNYTSILNSVRNLSI